MTTAAPDHHLPTGTTPTDTSPDGRDDGRHHAVPSALDRRRALLDLAAGMGLAPTEPPGRRASAAPEAPRRPR